jgi:hypothetical protein
VSGGEPGWPDDDEVVEALRQSGHLLEQEIAAGLETVGFATETNRAFADPEEGKSRELDVWATRTLYEDDERQLRVFIQLLIECKSSRAPFVVLTRPLGKGYRRSPPQELSFPVPEYHTNVTNAAGRSYRVVPAFFYLELDQQYWPWTDGRRGVAIIRLDRQKDKWAADNTGIFDSLVYPLAKAMLAFRNHFNPTGRATPVPGHWKYVGLFLPVVVLDSRLYVVDGSSNAPQVEVVQHVRVQRELRTKHLQGLFGIDVVHRDYLLDWVSRVVVPFGEHVVARVTAEPWLTTKTSPSVSGP